jgi:mevalonate kinase
MEGGAKGFGRGKVILLGEHAVVHRVPAIAVGLRRGVTRIARAADEDLLLVAPWSRVACPDPQSPDPLSRAFAQTLASHRNRPRLRLDVHVGLPPGAGLGCSTAIGVSVLDAIDNALGIECPRVHLGTRAFAWERIFHEAPSGIDNAVYALGGPIRFERGRGASTVRSGSPFHLAIAHSGPRSETKEMVAAVARRLKQQPDETRRLFDEVGAIVGSAEQALREGEVSALGRQFDRNHAVLRTLRLSTPQIEALRCEAKSGRALGAKVTGSGGGGWIVALAEDAGHARLIANRLGNGTFVAEVARGA